MLRYRTEDHPEANGRKPVFGERIYTFNWLLEDGSRLEIEMGKDCRDAFKRMLEQEEIDDLADSNPKDN